MAMIRLRLVAIRFGEMHVSTIWDLRSSPMLNKVPEVTLIFWTIKILSTTVGETGADYLAVHVGLGVKVTAACMASLLIVALMLQLRARRYVPWIYWLTVVLVSKLKVIADKLDANVAAVALAWVRSRPGISSTIIGARRMGQLDANLAALDVTLSADQIASLDALTQPTLNFPADLLRNLSLNLAHAGATVNGEPSARLASLLPASADEVY